MLMMAYIMVSSLIPSQSIALSVRRFSTITRSTAELRRQLVAITIL